jgi:predicted permease
MVTSLLQDLKFAGRLLAKSRAFGVVAIVSLGVGIGSATAVLTTVDDLLNSDPANVSDPDQLVMLHSRDPTARQLGDMGFSFGQYQDLIEAQNVFGDVAAYFKTIVLASSGGVADDVNIEFVSGNYFSLLGLAPALGRPLLPEDDMTGRPLVAVISYDYWLNRLAGASDVLSRTIKLNGSDYQIVGVLPRSFQSFELDVLGLTGIWVPFQTSTALGVGSIATREDVFVQIIARLIEPQDLDVLEQQAQLWIDAIRPFGSSTYTVSEISVLSAREMRIYNRQTVRTFFGWSIVVSVLILMAACLNTANILLDRAMLRRREMALRVALGAPRTRLFRQVLVEAALIAALAAVVGVAVASAVGRILAAMPWLFLSINVASGENPLSAPPALDMIAGVAALSFAAMLLFGLAPAFFVMTQDPNAAIRRSEWRFSLFRVRLSLRQLLLSAQTGVAVTLIVIAGLCTKSLVNIVSDTAGYSAADSLLIGQVVANQVPADRRPSYYRELLQRLEAMPTIESATIGWNPPLRVGRGFVSVPGRDGSDVEASMTAGGPAFFSTQGIGVVAGEEFYDYEREDDQRIIINRVLADRLWPEQDVVGRTLLYSGAERTVVAVVAEDSCNGPTIGPLPCAWLPYPLSSSSGFLRIRTRAEPAAVIPTVRRLVTELDPDAALVAPQPFTRFFARLTGTERAAAYLTLGLAAIGVLLLVIGSTALYVSMVRNSAREIATQVALGATRGRLIAGLVARGMMLTAFGVSLGIVAALFLAHRVSDRLHGVEPADWPTFAISVVLVVGIGLVTIYFSGCTVSRVDPAKVLREN